MYTYLLEVFSGELFKTPTLALGEPVQIEYVFDCPEFQTLRENIPLGGSRERMEILSGHYVRIAGLHRG